MLVVERPAEPPRSRVTLEQFRKSAARVSTNRLGFEIRQFKLGHFMPFVATEGYVVIASQSIAIRIRHYISELHCEQSHQAMDRFSLPWRTDSFFIGDFFTPRGCKLLMQTLVCSLGPTTAASGAESTQR